MITRRLIICVLTGAALGIVCVIGAQIRSGFEQDAGYLFSFWYNRLIMGLMIGLIGTRMPMPKVIWRGAILGFLVSFAFFASTGFEDIIGLLAGVVYGVIIEYVALKLGDIK